MIPWSRSKRKYAKAGEADTVDETNYGAPIEETSFIQVKFVQVFRLLFSKPPPQRPPSDTGSYETYARSDTGEYFEYDQRHNQAARKMHQILHRIKMLKIAAVMQAPVIIVMVVMLFGYPKLLFGDPCLSVNLTTTLMNSTTLPTAPVTFNTTTLVIWGTSSEFITEALLTDTNGDMTSIQLGELGGRSAWSYCSLTFENAVYFLGYWF